MKRRKTAGTIQTLNVKKGFDKLKHFLFQSEIINGIFLL